MYPAEIVIPMKKELTDHGFLDLDSGSKVSDALNEQGTTLVVINSVCGCAAGNARPAALMASKHDKTPDRLSTVFAGFDIDAVNTAREFMLPFPASSPSMALFKDGKLVHFIERHQIEGRPAEMIADSLKGAFDAHC